jgi:hypothetical protein
VVETWCWRRGESRVVVVVVVVEVDGGGSV